MINAPKPTLPDPALPTTQKDSPWRYVFAPVVIVAALGYFVDIYDLTLFSIVRKASLQTIGVLPAEMETMGRLLLNLQMAGMLLGGILWGILGDKRGRLTVLFGSIALYSIANVANGFVESVEQYAALRFLAGIGLAGELGAGVALVAESLPKAHRGWGTTLVVSFGAVGAILAGWLGEHLFWRTNYFIGGGLGLALLLLRVSLTESGVYKKSKTAQAGSGASVKHGDFLSFFSNWPRFVRFMRCVAIGLPVWFIVGILITFSPELAILQGVKGEVVAAKSVSLCYLGLVVGDVLSGAASQWWRSRKKVVAVFLGMSAVTISTFLLTKGLTPDAYYLFCFALGTSTGYWIVLMTLTAEQFGTNIRATAATTVPNFIRGAVIPITLLYATLGGYMPKLWAAGVVGAFCVGAAGWALVGTKETFHNEIDFVE